MTKEESTSVSFSVTLPRTSKERERAGRAKVRPVSWRAEEVTRGVMAESEQETMLAWVSQTLLSKNAKDEVVSVLRHSGGQAGTLAPTERIVATRLPRAS